MEIILKEDVPKLGKKDEVLKVKDGYARNYLIPKGLASVATSSTKKMLAEIQKQRAFKEEKLRKEAQLLANKIKKLDLKVGAKVGTTGRIFGSINNLQIALALTKHGFEIDRKKITLPENIEKVGYYTAKIQLQKDVEFELSFEVVGE